MTDNRSGSGGALQFNQRAVSTTLGYSLVLAITAILVTGLLIAGGTLVEDQRERIADEELSVTAEQLASGIGDADRLSSTDSNGVLRVTVWLPDRIAGGAYTLELENQPTDDGQPAKATIIADSQAVDVTAELSIRTTVPVANQTVVGGPVVISHRDDDGDGNRELVITESTKVAPEEPEPAVMAHEEIVYVNDSSGELSSVAPDGTVTGYGVDAEAIAPKQVDLDGDGLREIAYVDSTNRLNIVDESGEVQTLANDAANSPLQNSYGTMVTIAEWDGETSVFYLNTSDVGPNNEGTIYRVGLSGDQQQVIANSSEVEANAIVGAGDINDDGDSDLVFVGPSQNMSYIDGNEVTDTEQTVDANTGIGAGAPRQFASGQADRVPFVVNNNVSLLSYAGGTASVTQLTTGGQVEPTFVAGVDWVGDNQLEVVYVDASDGSLHYVALNGTTGSITDSDGNPITVDSSAGTA